MKQQRNTRQRQLVLDVVRGRRDHPTAEQIYQSVREQDAYYMGGVGPQGTCFTALCRF